MTKISLNISHKTVDEAGEIWYESRPEERFEICTTNENVNEDYIDKVNAVLLNTIGEETHVFITLNED